MKIKFLIGYPAISFATAWEEIRKLPEQTAKPDEETFILFKALELNKELDHELIRARKKLHLPESGLSWEEYKKRKDVKGKHTEEEVEEIIYYLHHYLDEINKIKRKMYLHPQVQEQLDNLILGYFVEPYYKGIDISCSGANTDDYEDFDDFDKYTEVDDVSIHIGKRISKNKFIKYIEDHWASVDKLLKLLPETKDFYISQRDLRIVELRDNQNLKYNQIAEQIIKEFSVDNLTGSINEDSIKTSYKRAKAKIDDLAKKR